MSRVTVSCEGVGPSDLKRYLTDLLEAVSKISGYEFEVHRADGEHDRDARTGQYTTAEDAAARPGETVHEGGGDD